MQLFPGKPTEIVKARFNEYDYNYVSVMQIVFLISLIFLKDEELLIKFVF